MRTAADVRERSVRSSASVSSRHELDDRRRVAARAAQEIAIGARHPVLALDGNDHDIGCVAIQTATGIEDFLTERTKSRLVQIDVQSAGDAPTRPGDRAGIRSKSSTPGRRESASIRDDARDARRARCARRVRIEGPVTLPADRGRPVPRAACHRLRALPQPRAAASARRQARGSALVYSSYA